MEKKSSAASNQPARYSRVLNVPKVFALGASVSLGVGIFGIFGFLLEQFSPAEMKKPFLLLIVLALPIVITYVEKAVNLRGFNGIYEFLKNTNELWASFFGSWFMVLGYVAMIALTATMIGSYVQSFIRLYFDFEVDVRLLIVTVVLLQTAGIFIRRGIKRSIRSSFVLVALLLLLLIVVQGFFSATSIDFTRNFFGTQDVSFSIVALLMSTMWGMFFIFRERKGIIKPRKNLLPVTLTLLILIGLLGFLSAMMLAAYRQSFATLVPFAELELRFAPLGPDLVALIYAVLVVGCSFYVMRKSYYDGVHFVNLMVNDGFLIKRDENNGREFFWLWPVVGFSILAILTILVSTPVMLIGVLALSFLVVTIFVHLPDFFRPRPRYARFHYLKLPFHPLFPGLSTVISGLLLFTLPQMVLLIGFVVGLLGLGYYLLIARKQAVMSRRDQIVVAEELSEAEAEEETHVYRVMVGIANPATAPNLIETAMQIAQARQGEVLAFRTISYSGEMSETSRRRKAQREYDVLTELLAPIDTGETVVRPLIRLATEPVEGILDTIVEENVDLIVLGWENKEYQKRSFMNTFINEVLRNAPCEVVIMSGEFPKRLRHVAVPTAGGPYASMGLSLACDLAEESNAKVSLLNVVQGRFTAAKRDEANQRLQETRSVLLEKFDGKVEPRVLDGDNIVRRLSREGMRTDLFLIGASKEGVLERPYFGGLPVELAANTRTPIMITRGIESTQRFFLQRVWGVLFDSLPSLNVTRRKEVMRSMRDAAKPTPDFFVLIVLASMIASLGLLQNSAAVIIGAMLVAPLMSPILAMGMSLVLGNIRQFYEATETAVKGIAVAILVGTLVSIVSPINAATTEILSRTAPNILDLMVAIASGAAAGYAMSRREVSAAMPGVAISAALVPPLCVIGYGLGTAQFDIASGAMLLFVTNLIAILLSAAVVFLALGFYPQRANRAELMRTLRITLISLVAVTGILAISTVATVNQANREKHVNQVFTQFVNRYDLEILDLDIQKTRAGYEIQSTLIENGTYEISPAELDELQNTLELAVEDRVTVNAIMLSAMDLDTKFSNQADAIRYDEVLDVMQATGLPFTDVAVMQTETALSLDATLITNQSLEELQQALQELQQQLEMMTDLSVEMQINRVEGELISIE